MASAEDLAMWAERIRDLSALGLNYAENVYDRERYATLQDVAAEMLAAAVGTTTEDLKAIAGEVLKRPTPFTSADAAIIDEQSRILLIQRGDNGMWAMPGGAAEVGETVAQAAVREAEEETGVKCEPVSLIGIYDNRLWGSTSVHHVYMVTFLCRPVSGADLESTPSHENEIMDRRWFARDELPSELDPRHRERIPHAFQYFDNPIAAHFDQ